MSTRHARGPERAELRARIEPARPEHLALVDVADAAAEPLVEEHVADLLVAVAEAAMRATQTAGRRRRGTGRGRATRGRGDDGRSSTRKTSTSGALKHTASQPSTWITTRAALQALPPVLAQPVQVPRARHAHVGVQHEPSSNVISRCLPGRFDRSITEPIVGRRPTSRGASNCLEAPADQAPGAAARRCGGSCRPQASGA